MRIGKKLHKVKRPVIAPLRPLTDKEERRLVEMAADLKEEKKSGYSLQRLATSSVMEESKLPQKGE